MVNLVSALFYSNEYKQETGNLSQIFYSTEKRSIAKGFIQWILDFCRETKGRQPKKKGIKSEIGIIYLTPLPPYLKSEKQKNEILVCLRPPLPPAKSEKFGRL